MKNPKWKEKAKWEPKTTPTNGPKLGRVVCWDEKVIYVRLKTKSLFSWIILLKKFKNPPY